MQCNVDASNELDEDQSMADDRSHRFTVTFTKTSSRSPINHEPVSQRYVFSHEGCTLCLFATLHCFFKNGGRIVWENFCECPELFLLIAPYERFFAEDMSNFMTVTTALNLRTSDILGRTHLDDNEMLEVAQTLSFLLFNKTFSQSNLVSPVTNIIMKSIMEAEELIKKHGYSVFLTFDHGVMVLLRVFEPTSDPVRHETLICKIFAKSLVDFSFPNHLVKKVLKQT